MRSQFIPVIECRRSKINGKGATVVDISTKTTESPTFLSPFLSSVLGIDRAPLEGPSGLVNTNYNAAVVVSPCFQITRYMN